MSTIKILLFFSLAFLMSAQVGAESHSCGSAYPYLSIQINKNSSLMLSIIYVFMKQARNRHLTTLRTLDFVKHRHLKITKLLTVLA